MGLAGYGCLVVLMLGGFLGGSGLVFLSVSRFMSAADTDLSGGADTEGFLDTLEGSVAAAGFGAVVLLVGVGATIVLLKEMADESSRRARGPVRQSE